MGQLEMIALGCSVNTEGIVASECVEIGIRLSTSPAASAAQVDSVPAGRDWIGQGSQQVCSKDIVKTVFAPDLDTSRQAGRPNNTKLGSLRQEYNASLSGWFEMNGSEGLSYPVHLPARCLGFCRGEPTTLVVEDASVLVMAVLQA
jgi:hypothetical protein